MSAVQHVLLPNVSTSRRDLTSKTRTPAFITELIASRRPSGLNVMLRTGSPPITQGLPPVAGKTRTLPLGPRRRHQPAVGADGQPPGLALGRDRHVAEPAAGGDVPHPDRALVAAVTTRLLSGLNTTPVRSISSARNF